MTRADQAKGLANEVKWAMEALEDAATELEQAKKKHRNKQIEHSTALEKLQNLASQDMEKVRAETIEWVAKAIEKAGVASKLNNEALQAINGARFVRALLNGGDDGR